MTFNEAQLKFLHDAANAYIVGCREASEIFRRETQGELYSPAKFEMMEETYAAIVEMWRESASRA